MVGGESADVEAARLLAHTWLAEHLPEHWLRAIDDKDESGWIEANEATDLERLRVELGESGLATPTWPREYCGLSLSPESARAVDEILTRYRLPRRMDFVGRTLASSTLLEWGTPEQKQQFLPGIATGQEFWCQLFSEPGAGSDLASLATRAVPQGDAWVINGQKVWSSGAHLADFGLLLARTDPTQPKRRGITYFILDMTAPGVEVRPLRQSTGDCDFNEVFLTDVVMPDDRRVGPVNSGWHVATTTLLHERSGLSDPPSFSIGELGRVIDHAISSEQWQDAHIRDRLLALLVDERALHVTNLADSENDSGGGAAGSITKLFRSILDQRVAEAAVDIGGLEAVALDSDRGASATETSERLAGRALGDAGTRYVRSRALTILGGTSEIQRNIIGERVLGLPRDPDPWSSAPWRDVPRG